MSSYTTSGIEVDDDPITEDITIGSAATEWEQLADAFADGRSCIGCLWHEIALDHRECAAEGPMDCPSVNPRALANALRRQAS